MNSLRTVVPDESWRTFFAVVLGVWLMIWLYASIHNQYLIRIAPEHFTVWHYKIPFIRDHSLLGIAYAFGASISPGVILGMALYLAGRLFNRPKLRVKQIIVSTVWVWIAVELCAISAGLIVWHNNQGFYPDWVYPDNSRGLLTTQSIQITTYLSGAFFSVILVFWTWRRRKTAESCPS